MYKALIGNILNPLSFSSKFQEKFFENNLHMSYQNYKKLYKQEGRTFKAPIFSKEDIGKALKAWMEGNNYSKAVKWSRMLDKFIHYLPPKVREVPANIILYRGIHVAKTAFEKLTERDKPLVLKNRKYSSWTADIRIAKDFASMPSSSKIGVVLGHKFLKEDLLLDVQKVFKYLGLEDQINQEEKEIIVKNGNKDYKFTPKDIVLYQDEWNRWKKL